MFLLDGLRNLMSNLGTSRDKAESSQYVFQPLSRAEIISAYRSAWLPKKIVQIPAQDATRAWRKWSADDEQIKKIEDLEKELMLQIKVERAMRLARLLGGAAIYIGLRDRTPELPVVVEQVKAEDIEYLTVLGSDWVSATEVDTDPGSKYFGSPKSYNLSLPSGTSVQNVHPSRLAIFHADDQPEWEVNGGLNWGDSVIQAVYNTVRNHDSTTSSVASLVFEAKIDLFKIPDLMKNAEDPRYQKKLNERMAIAALSKSINGMLVMDAKEEFEQRTYSFAALADIIDRFAQEVSGAADIPMTRLFGRSPGGMNATGDSDMRNYYDSINSIQNNRIRPALSVLDDLILISALGSKPDDIDYEWNSLWQTSQKEDAEVASSVVSSLKTLADMRALPDETMQAIVVSSITELKALNGVKSAVDEFGLEVEDPFKSNELILAAASEAAAAEAAGENGGKPGQKRGVATKPGARVPAKGRPATKTKATAQDAAPRSLYVRRDVVNAKEIHRWAVSQGLKEVTPAEELHVTIVYSKTAVDWFAVGSSWEDKVEIVGGPRLVERFPGGPVVLLIPMSSLKWRHREMIEAGATTDYPDYQPHITLSYDTEQDISKILPYQGPIVLGPEVFEEIKVKPDA
jgi:uncharacterized protein